MTKSISYTATNLIYTSKFTSEILSLSDNRITSNHNCKLLHDDFTRSYAISKHSEENLVSHLFEQFLQTRIRNQCWERFGLQLFKVPENDPHLCVGLY